MKIGRYRHSEETKAKIGAASRGRRCTEETKAKISAALTGRKYGPCPLERKRKISEAKRGKRLSAEHKAKIAAGGRGRKHTAETKAKISAAMKGKPRKKHTAETKARMSVTRRAPEAIQKRHRTWAENGNISVGQRKLYEILLSLGIPFLPECYFPLGKIVVFVDTFLPLQNLAVEYDGHTGHYTPKGVAKDRKRDTLMLAQHGIKTLRIGQKDVFTPKALCQVAEMVAD